MLPNRSLWVWRAPYVSAAVCEHDVVAGYVADAGREFLVREPVPAERVDREVQPSLREHKYGCQIRLNTQTRCSDYYRPQTKFAKVMFSHLSVSHSVFRRGWGGRVVSKHALQVVSQDVLEVLRWGRVQAHTWGDVYPSMHWGRTPPPPWTATATGGTHPTGMHSCLFMQDCSSLNLVQHIQVVLSLHLFQVRLNLHQFKF